ncbi:hypothetical protein [Paenibacillus sp. FSL R5-0345]|uniref:hypothetical protein n=1 Tax=Paenibacillus sp. FSL R5-0345 TaxID=1536770 RepID=UPI0006939774|nr:hypothetical protein [Paenibacillus sp. FSL R5-0345]
MMDESWYITPAEVKKEEWARAKCDKYDYMIAAFCGAAAGLIDVLFVGAPGMSKLGKITDEAADELVKKAAKLAGWNPRSGNENNIASAIGFFERNYGVNYDQKNTSEVNDLFNMAPKNHHYKSLSHSPDPIGLFFSILDQFMNTSSFLSDGKLIRIDTTDLKSPLKGGNFIAKIFSGFCNWLGHIMSDMAGSSGNRGLGSLGRGTGVSIPFMELFQLCDFGEFQVGKDRQTLAVVMTRVFQEGYDLRFGAAMAIPVLIEELMIRAIWVIRQRFYEKKDWSECIPTKQHADLRIMLIVGNGVLCLIDGTDAAVHGLIKGGNVMTFILHLNYVAWARLIMLVLRELRIRLGPVISELLSKFEEAILYHVTPRERKVIQQFYERIQQLDVSLEILLQEFTLQIEKEYQLISHEIVETFSSENSSIMQAEHSITLAKLCGVNDSKIIKSNKDLDDFFI